jgi:hypothetical protein
MAIKKTTPRGGPGAKRVAKKTTTTKSRGSKTAKQMGDMNAMESTRVNKYYPDKITTAQASKGKKSGFRMNEAIPGFMDQRAGGSKNISFKEMQAKKLKAKTAAANKGVANKPKGSMAGAKRAAVARKVKGRAGK